MDEPGNSYPRPFVTDATLELVARDYGDGVAREQSSLPSRGRNFSLEPGTSNPSTADDVRPVHTAEVKGDGQESTSTNLVKETPNLPASAGDRFQGGSTGGLNTNQERRSASPRSQRISSMTDEGRRAQIQGTEAYGRRNQYRSPYQGPWSHRSNVG